ncbi:SGNH/GDSL hydrolase family protein [Luteibacter jiangsuensis]|uniref:SGNH/GDSL hydrolase family protein n=1 Tax=Luteibacter jiangsuensis TaxID=637577 RepID=A0ABX0Q3U5_9GAMM|nr:SGNH/GDSL hydrolase family protein [Luteibacter jiangsuensis]NID03883.1 SGNH/GDSL hydrolase family protein [Luteibacter jiangsuensis]
MRRCLVVAILTLFALAGAQASEPEHRVLFIGNSLTYVNDLPNAFASLAPDGTRMDVDMIASPGASLADAMRNPLVTKALTEGGYTDVILQERGGDAFCPAACRQEGFSTLPAMRSAREASRMARAAGARVFYLGTWQSSRETNEALEFGERAIASASGAAYVEIAEPRRKLMQTHPELAWTHADGQHPGYATTAMMALRLWRAMFGVTPTTVPCVAGEVHYHAPKPEGVLHIDLSRKPRTCLVPSDAVRKLAVDP